MKRFIERDTPPKSGTNTPFVPKNEDSYKRCVNGLILGGITTGFADFFGVSPNPDPTSDFIQPARDLLKSPAFKVAAAVTTTNVIRRLASRKIALRAAAAVSEDVIPVAGQLILTYQLGHAVYSGFDYYISGINSGACGN